MAGVTSSGCPRWSGQVALLAVGALPSDEGGAVSAHLEACATCRRELEELASVGEALGRLAAGPPVRARQLGASEVPEGLGAAVTARLETEVRRRRWRRAGMVAGAAAVVVGGAVVAATVVPSSPAPGRAAAVTVALRGTAAGGAPVTVTAQLSAARWGTVVRLREKGQPAGQVFTVTMRGADGYWWSAGSYRAAGAHSTVQLSCGAPLGKIVTIEVHGPPGTGVLTGQL